MAVRFNSAIYQKGEIEINRSLIRAQYLRNDFTIDMLCFLTLNSSIIAPNSFVRLIFLFKIAEVSKFFETYRNLFNLDQKLLSLF